MKAALYEGVKKVRIVDIPKPVPGPGEYVIKMNYNAISGTDLHAYLFFSCHEFYTKGRDDDFFKPTTHLFAIEKAPFYAFSHYLGNDGAVGGLTINENAQVMGHNGPIGGLYATGDTTASRFINRGGIRTEITNDMTWAVASGYLAGENIGEQLTQS